MVQANAAKEVERTARTRAKRKSERVLDNIESLAVAVVLALLIRHFVIQPFEIPTGSMKPTLIGQESFGDRILVDMFSYKFSDPKRWDVVVFRYPLNRGLNFVKRLVGLPGEQLEVRNGDDYVNGAIERKPRSIQNGLWEHWPVYEFESNFRSAFDETGDGKWMPKDDHWNVVANGEAFLKWKSKAGIGEGHLGGSSLLAVGDRLLRFRCRLEKDQGEVIAEIREGADTLRLHLGSKGSGGGVYVSRGDEMLARRSELKLEPHRWYSIAFGNPDEQIQVDIDGDSIVYEPYRSLGGTADTQAILLGASSTEASFRGVEIDRDLFHSSDGSHVVQVPSDSFFMLGDNTTESKDSRLWYTSTIRTPGSGTATIDDEELTRKYDFAPPGGPPREIIDQFGEVYTFERRPEDLRRKDPAPFVRRDLLLGRAFFVFFPFNRTSPFRLNWRAVH